VSRDNYSLLDQMITLPAASLTRAFWADDPLEYLADLMLAITDMPDARLNRGVARWRRGDVDGARRDFVIARDDSRSEDLLVEMAEANIANLDAGVDIHDALPHVLHARVAPWREGAAGIRHLERLACS
jgi:hypothetical protein